MNSKHFCSSAFQKYSEIRSYHAITESIENDIIIVKDDTFVSKTLLSACYFTRTNVYNLVTEFRKNPALTMSGVIVNPFDYVTCMGHIISYETAKKIELKYKLNTPLKARILSWAFDHILFQNNTVYVKKTNFLRAFVREFDSDNIENLLDICENVVIDSLEFITLQLFYEFEKKLGDKLIDLFDEPPIKTTDEEFQLFASHYEIKHDIRFTKKQSSALRTSIEHKLSIICGYPGTGKSTIANAICAYHNTSTICLMAPTGMAVKSLRSKCPVEERFVIGTVHKMVYDQFYKVAKNPSLIIVDEFSMIDIVMFDEILRWCVIFDCKLVILADENQLPPIGAGCPLLNILKSGLFRTTYLKTIKRQNKGALKTSILNMNKNIRICAKDFCDNTMFFYSFNTENVRKLVDTYRLTDENTQFITPQHKHVAGTIAMNSTLQTIYKKNNKPTIYPSYPRPYSIHVGDRVTRTVNDYSDTENFYANGDVGVVHKSNNELSVKYLCNDGSQKVTASELYDEFQLAYCLTVHKVQGSQYENIVLLIDDEHESSWDTTESKKLLYTAMSRATKRCFILGSSNLFTKAQTDRKTLERSVFMKTFNNFELRNIN
jgi:exodeoxyribonuclease V alpha subunit